MRHPNLLTRTDTLLLLIDVQEKLVPAIADHAAVMANCAKLLRGCAVLGVPALMTEQYVKGLGPTVPELASIAASTPRMEKLTFSCCGEPAVRRALAESGRKTVLVARIEAHVCVSQTVHDLLADGYRVQIAADAVGSRRPADREAAMERMRAAGAVVTTTEAALFELLERAGTAEFKEMLKLLK